LGPAWRLAAAGTGTRVSPPSPCPPSPCPHAHGRNIPGLYDISRREGARIPPTTEDVGPLRATLMDEYWRVTVDRNACLGSGLCAATAPEYFRLDDGRPRPLRELADPEDVVLATADPCPAEAIVVHDAAGRQLAPER